MYRLYSLALVLGLVAYAPVLLLGRRRGGYARSLGQRLGRFGPLPPEPRCWVHAVSVGEAAAAAPLVEAIRRRWPEMAIVMTTVTPTGARIIGERLGEAVTHRYFPLDLPGSVRRALDAVRPRLFIGIETELWPNLLKELSARGIPSMIANGRISDRSFGRYRLVRPFMRRMLRCVTVFGMQSPEDARRIMALGAPAERVVVTGNLKADLQPEPPGGDALWNRLLSLEATDQLWIAGSTHRGEEAVVLDVWQRLRARFRHLVLLLAPRHPERVEEVEQLVRERGLTPVRRTALPRQYQRGAVIILDTVGELAASYQAADVVFVGGGLVAAGGHNMLEPALRRKPVLFGPYTSNFRESAELVLQSGGGQVVRDAGELERAIARLLEDPALGRKMGEAGFAAVAARQGAISDTMALIERFLVGART